MTTNIYGRIQNPNVVDQFSIGVELNDKEYSGFIIYDNVLDDVNFGDLLYYDLSLKGWKKSSCDDINKMPARSIYVGKDNIDQNVLLLYGTVKNLDWINLSKFIYVGINGTITSTPTTQSNSIIQKIGLLENSSIIFFNFETTWLYVV